MAFWMDSYDLSRPSRIQDQRFGTPLDPEDFLAPMMTPRELLLLLRGPAGHLRAWRSQASRNNDAEPAVCVLGDQYETKLDVQQFKPEEITVYVGGNVVTVEGKHQEKEDEHGYVARHFVRRYVLPKGHDMDNIESKLSSDGVLTITVPKMDRSMDSQRKILVIQTGKPSEAVEEKKSTEQDNKEERVVVQEHKEKDAEKK